MFVESGACFVCLNHALNKHHCCCFQLNYLRLLLTDIASYQHFLASGNGISANYWGTSHLLYFAATLQNEK